MVHLLATVTVLLTLLLVAEVGLVVFVAWWLTRAAGQLSAPSSSAGLAPEPSWNPDEGTARTAAPPSATSPRWTGPWPTLERMPVWGRSAPTGTASPPVAS